MSSTDSVVECVACNGAGRGKLFKHRCPIEGDKMSTLHICLMCEGDGFLKGDDPRVVGMNAYREAMVQSEEERKKEIAQRRLERAERIRKIYCKLSKDDIEMLGLPEAFVDLV